ncbi:MAG: acyltransferase [Candidatus Thorarchaeota archaeon]|jgi:acetyltransferase-like isoleucine patch superfamily enzyme
MIRKKVVHCWDGGVGVPRFSGTYYDRHGWIEFGQDVEIWGTIHFVRIENERGHPKPIYIGDKTVIQNGAVIYGGCYIRDQARIGHHAVLRSDTFLGTHAVFGNLSVCEGHTVIADHASVNSQCHITAHAKIHPYVFFGPNVTMMNDRYMAYRRERHGQDLEGPTIKRGARIGAAASILAGMVIGEYAVIGAGTVVTKDIPREELWYGVPARRAQLTPMQTKALFDDFPVCREHQNIKDALQDKLLAEASD